MVDSGSSRTGRALLSVALGCLTWGCGPDTQVPAEDPGITYAEFTSTFCTTPRRKIDLLLVVDDSVSMGPFRELLSQNVGGFAQVLEVEDFEAEYRVGVVSSSVTGPGCPNGDDGRLLWGSCLARMLEADADLDGSAFDAASICAESCVHEDLSPRPTPVDGAPSTGARPWLERIPRSGAGFAPNVDLPTDEALICAAQLQAGGCRYEQPLEAMRLAIDRMHRTDDPAFGFLRRDAIFMVVFIGNEDDCSIQDPGPFETGAPSAVCWNAGTRCTGLEDGRWERCEPEDRRADGTPTDDAQEAVLYPVEGYVELLHQLDVAAVRVGVLGGVPFGYNHGQQAIPWTLPASETDEAFGVGAACIARTAEIRAYPPPRLLHLAEQANLHQSSYAPAHSLCADNWLPILDPVTSYLRPQLRPGCFESCVEDVAPDAPGLQASCRTTMRTDQGAQEVPLCIDGELPEGAVVCVEYLSDEGLDPVCADEGHNLQRRLRRDPTAPDPQGACFETTCRISTNPAQDCPEPDEG